MALIPFNESGIDTALSLAGLGQLGKAAIHMVSAWASANRLVLGQVKTDEKSNEITAIPELLKLLVIKVLWSKTF